MNNEDAVKTLKAWMECMVTDCDYECEHCHIQAAMATDVVEACAVAVTELSQLDTDTISRKAAIEEIARWIGYIDEDMILRIQTGLKRLSPSQLIQPSAQPDRKNVDGYLFNLYRNGLSLIGPESVMSREHWIKRLYEEIYGEGERPVWMRKDKE